MRPRPSTTLIASALLALALGRSGRADDSSPVSYRREVSALFSRAGCNAGACHGNLSGKGGFRLSLRGEDPTFDLAMITRDHQGRRVNFTEPAASLVLAKPAGRVPHEGGRRFGPDSPEARILERWIADGAVDDESDASTVLKLEVEPGEAVVEYPTLAQPLKVVATFADGATRDVTHLSTFDVDDPAKSSVDPAGVLQRVAPGESVVAVRYLAGKSVARVAFLAEPTGKEWSDRVAANEFDAAVFDKLRRLRVEPSPTITAAAFVRRATLDVLGVLPTAAEIAAFEADDRPDRKHHFVRALLRRPEYADFWALKWADLLRNEEKVMGPKGVWTLQRWLRDQIAADRPMAEFAAEFVTGDGSTWGNPPSSFYRTNRDPEACAESFAQIFLGVRMQCAKCHNHPFDTWTQDDYYGLAATFANIGRKQVNNKPRDKFDKHEISGDELVYILSKPARIEQPRSRVRLAPKPPGVRETLTLGPGFDARDELAAWLTRDNRPFARNLANRVWYHLIGRGVVEPVDDIRSTNPPSNPELLERLTDAFLASGTRVKPLIEQIVTSEVYALSADPTATNRADEANFARATVRLLPAEVLLDAVGQAAGGRSRFDAGRDDSRAVELAGVGMGGDFLKTFGKPERLLTCECERSESTTLAQAFQLLNGQAVRAAVEGSENRIGRGLAQGIPPDALLDDLYHASLGREPTLAERLAALEHVGHAAAPRAAWEDVLWALLNSKEFLLRH